MRNHSNSNKKQAVALQDLIKSFSRYLEKTRGLAPITIKEYCADIKRFFLADSKRNKINLYHMSPKKVIRLFFKYAQENSTFRTQAITFSLQSFFRYLKQAHLIKEDLVSVVPSVANRKKTSFPEVLTFEMTDLLLKSCTRKDPLGKRNYAILMLMINLGLRSCEVCNLKLSDFDWDMGEIIIRGKGSENSFPIFENVGKALVDYLKYGRPNCESGKVFIRSKRPFQGITTSCIRNMISSALNRCDLNPKKRGGHLLRHSFAIQLLERGASLEEISVVLRHKDIETTAIYAKASFSKLKAIVQRWPENVKMEGNHD